MNRKVRHCGLVIAAQTACVAVGLWMNHHFIVSSVATEYGRLALDRLAQSAAESARRLNESAGHAPGAETAAPILQTGAASAVSGEGIVLVDSGWRVAAAPPNEGAGGGDDETVFQPGQVLTWRPLNDDALAPAADQRGFLTTGGRTFYGAAAPLRHGPFRVLAYEPAARAGEAVSALTAPLFKVSLLTLVWSCALLGIGVYMILARFHDDIEGERTRTTAESLRQSQALVRTRDAVIFGLAKLADSRDPETGDHLERITAYSTTLASAMRRHPRFADHVNPGFIRLIGISSALHDIGKVGIEDGILLKPGPLSEAERRTMQKHAVIGGECLGKIERRLGSSNFLQMARQIAFGHHERWDGAGYPHGLAGKDIPLAARIVAVADVYDALSSRRIYKGPVPHEECVEIIRKEAGRQFDPDIVAVWLSIEGQFRRIAQQYKDQDERDDRTAPAPALPEVMAEDDSESVAALA